MKRLTKIVLTVVGTVLTLGILETNPAQAALLNFNLTLIEDNTSNIGTGTFQIDDANDIGSGFFEITTFQVTTPQGKFLTLANYIPSGPGFSLGFNPSFGGSIAGVDNQLEPPAVFSPVLVESVGSFLFFQRFSNRYLEDSFSPSGPSGLYTATLVTTEVSEPSVMLGILVAAAIGYGTRRKQHLL